MLKYIHDVAHELLSGGHLMKWIINVEITFSLKNPILFLTPQGALTYYVITQAGGGEGSLKCLCMIMGEGEEGSHDVNIILGGGSLMMMLGYKGGRAVKNLGKSDYVIMSKRSLILNVTSAKRLFFAVI